MSNADAVASFENAVRRTGAPDLSSIARSYLAAREEADVQKAVYSTAQEKLTMLENSLLSSMAEAGLKSIRLDDGQLLSSVVMMDYRLPPETEADLRERVIGWLKATGGESLIREQVQWQQFAAWCKEHCANGGSVHPAVVVSERKSIRVRRG